MARKIAIVNNKGGTTKTTTTVNLAGAYTSKFPSHKVLIVDTDAQGNSALSFNANTKDIKDTIYDVFMDNAKAEDCIVNAYGNIDIIPSNMDMNFLEFDLMKLIQEEPGILGENSLMNRYFNMLEGKIDGIDEMYDLIIFDTPPEMKAITSSVLSVVDEVIIPYEPDPYAVKGVMNIVERIYQIKNNFNNKLSIAGIMAVKVKARTNSHTTVINSMMKWAMRNHIHYFQVEVADTIRFSDSVTYRGLPATIHGRSSKRLSKFVEVYYNLLEELIETGAIKGDDQ